MRLLIDTVTFLWALRSPEMISQRARAAMSDGRAIREISVLSISEIAIKQSCGKLNLDRSELNEGLADLRISVLSYTAAHARQMFGLPLHHSDPFDRQIIAQALSEEIAIVTPDKAFRAYQGVEVIW